MAKSSVAIFAIHSKYDLSENLLVSYTEKKAYTISKSNPRFCKKNIYAIDFVTSDMKQKTQTNKMFRPWSVNAEYLLFFRSRFPGYFCWNVATSAYFPLNSAHSNSSDWRKVSKFKKVLFENIIANVRIFSLFINKDSQTRKCVREKST